MQKSRLLMQSGFRGANDEARTRYLHLGKVALYQMSYVRILYLLCFLPSLLTTCVIIAYLPEIVNTFFQIFFRLFSEH